MNFRLSEGAQEIVFLPLMELLEDGRVRFFPTTLKYHPESDPPLELVRSRLVELRGWRTQNFLPRLSNPGFKVLEPFGDLSSGPFEPLESHALVVLAQLRY